MRVCSTCGHSRDASLGPCLHDGPAPADGGASDLPKVMVELQAPAEEQLLAGSLVGDYQIEKVIGIGGMGVVYGAHHPMIGKRAAIKVLNARYCADRQAVDRFVQEAQSVNRIGHPNIVDIFTFGQLEDGRSYLVMEWLDGETLDARIERLQHLAFEEVLAILVPLTRALDAAHAAGVIHRDLKPENVLLIPDDEGLRVKLLDFGIAKLSTSTSLIATRTASGMTIGTPLFMSPEQAKGVGVGSASDTYSLGVLAYAMVCGKTPFESEGSSVEILNAHIKNPPLPPGALRADVPPALEALILELLAKDPEARPRLADVRLRLKRLAHMLATGSDEDRGVRMPSFRTSTVHRAQTGPPERASSEDPLAFESVASPSRRRRWIVPATAVLIAGVIATVAGVRAQRGDASVPAPPPAAAVVVAATSVEAPVVAPQAPARGWVELAIRPETAKVAIDGKSVVLANGRARVELAPGVHAIVVVAGGHVGVRREIDVTAARGSELALHLERAKAKPARKRPGAPVDADAVVNPFARRSK